MRTCPHCGKPILQRNDRAGEGWVIRGTRLLTCAIDGTVRGHCWSCGGEIELPLKFIPTPASARRVVQ